MEKDIWFINASNVQKEMLQRFIEKYEWEQFEHGCYLEYDSVTLMLQTFGKPDQLEVQLRQNKTFTIGDGIATKCQISLFETETHTFEKNLITTYMVLQKEIIKVSEANNDVIDSLQSFSEHLYKNLCMMIAMGAKRNLPK